MVCIPRKNITSDERLGDLLDKCIRNHPDNDAIVYVDRDIRLSWKEWGVEVDRVAKGMMAMGVQKGEKVAVWATNVPDWVTIMFATAKIGAIMLTINTNYRSAELDYVLRQSDMENLFLIDGVRDVDYVQTVYDLVPELKTQPRDSFHSEKYPHLRRVVHLGPEKHRGMYSMNEVKSLACQTSDEEYQERKDSVDVHDVTMMQYTSGTTGFPKGVMLTHFNIANDGYWLGANMNYGPTDRLCLNVPLFHCFGCVLGVMACINHGVTMCFVEVFDPIKVMTTIETEKCTAVYGVPTMFISILNNKLFDKFDFSSLRTGIMAGSPCPIKTMEEVVDKMNMKEITIVYGLTEASPGMTQTTYDEPSIEKKCSSVGKRLQGVDTVILDPDTNEKYLPYVIEPSMGLDRLMLMAMIDSYDKEELEGGDTRTVMHLKPFLAPYKVAVLPLSKKLSEKAEEVLRILNQHLSCTYDVTGSIGKRYRRQDEIGTPYCVTIDFDTLNDQCVTVRERDSMKQIRLPITELVSYFTIKCFY